MTAETNLMTEQYVYGIVPAGAQLPPGLTGVDGEQVEALASGGFAALVSPVENPDDVGTPDNLVAHSRVLDEFAAAGPVLPMTFGTIVPDVETITDSVLPSMQQAYRNGIDRVEGAAQFTVRARYARDRVLAEMVEENGEIAALRESTANRSEEESHFDRIRLGELVVEEFQRRAAVDSGRILDALEPLARETSTREASQADHVVEVAALVDREQQAEFERTVEALARDMDPRVTFRLLGPQAPYDFVEEI